MQTITNLGTIGTTAGILRPLDLTLQRDGATWDLTGYTTPLLRVWDARTKTTRTLTGTLAVLAPASNGIVRYTPAVGDPLFADGAGMLEARVTLIPGGVGDPESSNLFRFSIAPELGTP